MSTELTFEAATEATEPQLRRLLRDNPLTGDIHVSLEREPNAFHAAGISGDQYQMMLAFGAYINGNRRRIGYFGELRAQGGLKARRKLEDNHRARRLLEAGLGDMPSYQPLETMVTFTIPTRLGARRRRPSLRIARGNERPLASIATKLAENGTRYQFHPVWSQEILRSAKRCRGLAPENFLLCPDGDEDSHSRLLAQAWPSSAAA
jgi:hypothetical protein